RAPRHSRGPRGVVPARSSPPHTKLHPPGANPRRIVRAPRSRGVAILGAGGKPMLRREPIIDRDDDTTRGVGHYPADDIMRIEIARDPSAAVEENYGRGFRFLLCPGNAKGNLAYGSRDAAIRYV